MNSFPPVLDHPLRGIERSLAPAHDVPLSQHPLHSQKRVRNEAQSMMGLAGSDQCPLIQIMLGQAVHWHALNRDHLECESKWITRIFTSYHFIAYTFNIMQLV